MKRRKRLNVKTDLYRYFKITPKSKHVFLYFNNNKNSNNGYINNIYQAKGVNEEMKKLYEEKIKLLEDKIKMQEEIIAMLKAKE